MLSVSLNKIFPSFLPVTYESLDNEVCISCIIISLNIFTICLTPYNRKIKCVECVVKTFPSFLPVAYESLDNEVCISCIIISLNIFTICLTPYNCKIKCVECVVK